VEDEGGGGGFLRSELRDRVTGLYGVAPTLDCFEIAEILDNSGS
jgi:hypothetical protein